MRIGLVVDGEAEYASFPHIISQLQSVTGATILSPALAKLQPYAPAGQIALTASKKIKVLERKRVDRVVVLIDRETRPDCCGEFADAVQRRIMRLVQVDVAVVVKDRTYENWLVADVAALERVPNRFQVSKRSRSRIEPNKADGAPALEIIKTACRSNYEKVSDARAILSKADVKEIAENSRSFRRFLRCLGHPTYCAQSRRPCG